MNHDWIHAVFQKKLQLLLNNITFPFGVLQKIIIFADVNDTET